MLSGEHIKSSAATKAVAADVPYRRAVVTTAALVLVQILPPRVAVQNRRSLVAVQNRQPIPVAIKEGLRSVSSL